MKFRNLVKVIVLFIVFVLTLSTVTLEKRVDALSLDEIIENPDNIHQIALPLHYSERSDKKKVLDEIRKGYKEENNIELDGNFKDSSGNKYLVLIDADPTLSTTGLGDVDLSRMVNLVDVDKFTFSTGAYTYVVAKTKVIGGQAVIDQTSLKIGVVIAGVYSNVEIEVTGLDASVEAPEIVFDSKFALESDEEGVYNVVVGMSYTIIAEEIPNYYVSIEGLDASSRVFSAGGEDKVINIHYEKMTEVDTRVETRLSLNEKVTVGFAQYSTNSDIYKLAVSKRGGVINLATGYPIEGINPETMIEFKAEDKVTGSIVTDLSTLEAGTYEVTARFHGIREYCFSSEATFTLVVEKATADVEVNSCIVGYDAVLNGGLTKDYLVSIESNTLRENNVDHAYFVAGIDAGNRDIIAEVDLTHVLSHPSAMVQGEIDKQLLLITEENDPDGDGLTVSEFYNYVEELCKLANIKGIDFESERLIEVVNKLNAFADLANIKIKIVLDGERDITPNSYGVYVVGAIVTDMSYAKTYDVGVVTISAEPANVEFEGNDLSGIQIQNHTGTPNPLTANAYDLNGNLLDGTMSYLYVGVNLDGEKYISNLAPIDNGAYIVVAKFTNATAEHPASHVGVGLNILLIGDFEENLEEAHKKFEALAELSRLMKVFNSVEGFDYNLFTLLGMFDEEHLNVMFERVVNFINDNDTFSSALDFTNSALGVDSIEKIKDVITRLYSEVVERTVDIHFDSEEVSVYEYTGSQIALTATAYDENGNILNGLMTYFYTGYQANGQMYVSPYAPTHPGVYVVRAVYFDLSNGIKAYSYGNASKAFTITTEEISFALNGEELNDLEIEYDGTPKELDVVAKYPDGNLVEGGTLKVVYIDDEGNASFNAPTLPGEYKAIAFYTENDDFAVRYFGYKIINLSIVNQKALVDESDAVDCYDGEEHFK